MFETRLSTSTARCNFVPQPRWQASFGGRLNTLVTSERARRDPLAAAETLAAGNGARVLTRGCRPAPQIAGGSFPRSPRTRRDFVHSVRAGLSVRPRLPLSCRSRSPAEHAQNVNHRLPPLLLFSAPFRGRRASLACALHLDPRPVLNRYFDCVCAHIPPSRRKVETCARVKANLRDRIRAGMNRAGLNHARQEKR